MSVEPQRLGFAGVFRSVIFLVTAFKRFQETLGHIIEDISRSSGLRSYIEVIMAIVYH